jgi:hypothetical protein
MVRQAISYEEVDEDFFVGSSKRLMVDFAGQHPLGNQVSVPIARSLLGMKTYGNDSNILLDQIQRLTIGSVAVADTMRGDIESSMSPKEKGMAIQRAAESIGTLLGLPASGLRDFKRRLENEQFFPGFKEAEPEFDIKTFNEALNNL